eukprot:TRINITY_DN32564_c0_g1_i1.p1 TRINITY_DN32564_c0_g1~~TRINITY_DN32564_c0_g1_i1.p1  ORF type:complete len:296 (-),score=73.40 TRINITY_DN32564_c0_g1_i1:56-943(-)
MAWRDRTTEWTRLAQSNGQFIETSSELNRRLFVHVFNKDCSDDDAVTLVMVHGLGGRAEQFLEQVKYFRSFKRYNIIVPDLLGHGRSPKPRSQLAYRSDLFVEDIKVIAKKFGSSAKQSFVIGHSLGAMISLSIAQDHEFLASINCKGVALLGWTSAPSNPPPLFNCPDCFLECIRPVISRSAAKILYHESTDRRLIEDESKVTMQNPWHVFKGIVRGVGVLAQVDFSAVEIPVLVLHGEADGLAKSVRTKEDAKLLRKAQFVLVKGSGHNLMMEKPDVVSDHLLKWISELSANS